MKELNEQDKIRIENKWREMLFADEDWSVDECAIKLATYEHNYQREQQKKLRNKVIELEKEIKRLKEYDHFKLP